jgi:hypothetical protein
MFPKKRIMVKSHTLNNDEGAYQKQSIQGLVPLYHEFGLETFKSSYPENAISLE